jgi:hypothetical protein
MMKKVRLSFPQMLFVIGTRAALAGGVALLNSDRLKRQSRRRIGWILAGVGVLTTVPAAMMARRNLVA